MFITASHICAIVPTYNNAGTIADVVRRVYQQMAHIIVVNDGSTDATKEVLASLDIPFTLVSYPRNAGKGHALREGFRKAREMGFTHVLTIDADGQHYPEDIPQLYRMHTIHPEAIIIGSRGLKQDNMPGKNTFANRFSNFWFALQTGCRLPDTQTGFRIYPLALLHGERLMTSRYEAELELLVFSAWAEVDIVPVPVRVYYPPKEERVSHFRPAYDFTRISLLNTVLCLLAVVYGLPRRWWRTVYCHLVFLLHLLFWLQPGCFYLKCRYRRIEERRMHLHRFIHRYTRHLLGRSLLVPFRVSCEEGASPIDPQRPAIYIANHTSIVDLLAFMAIHPKTALVANDRVAGNPFFGNIAQEMDILPIGAGIETLLPRAASLVEQGFSIVILPEGTRSLTGELLRFHRGPFYLAEQLGLPIRPVLMRGMYAFYRKHTLYVGHPAELHICILPEVLPDDPAFGNGYKERTHAFAAYFRDRMDCFAYPYPRQ